MFNQSLSFAKQSVVNRRAERIIAALLKRNGSSSAGGGDKRHPPEYLDVAKKYGFTTIALFFTIFYDFLYIKSNLSLSLNTIAGLMKNTLPSTTQPPFLDLIMKVHLLLPKKTFMLLLALIIIAITITWKKTLP